MTEYLYHFSAQQGLWSPLDSVVILHLLKTSTNTLSYTADKCICLFCSHRQSSWQVNVSLSVGLSTALVWCEILEYTNYLIDCHAFLFRENPSFSEDESLDLRIFPDISCSVSSRSKFRWGNINTYIEQVSCHVFLHTSIDLQVYSMYRNVIP